jgi:DNA repair exonuclease SbcCD ATPase subunit
MSDRVLRHPLSVKLSTVSFHNQKRKSLDHGDENNENLPPNLSIKKVKDYDENCSSTTSDQKLKSSLPRYQRQQQTTAASSTPVKMKLRGNLQPSTPLSISKRIGRRSSCTPRAHRICSDKIASIFDQGLSINESKVIEIMAALKVKGKKQPFVDFKEKAKKYESVIKELRDALRIVLSEIPTLREKSIAHEAVITNLISEMDADLKETNGVREALEMKENQLSEELKIVCDELKSSAGLAESLKREHSPLKNRSQEIEALNARLQQEYEEELTCRQNNDIEILRLRGELQDAVASLDAVEVLRAKVRRIISLSLNST